MAGIFKYTVLVPKCKDCKRLLNIEWRVGHDGPFFSRFTEKGTNRLLQILENYSENCAMASAILTCGCLGKQVESIALLNDYHTQKYGKTKSEKMATQCVLQWGIVDWAVKYG